MPRPRAPCGGASHAAASDWKVSRHVVLNSPSLKNSTPTVPYSTSCLPPDAALCGSCRESRACLRAPPLAACGEIPARESSGAYRRGQPMKLTHPLDFQVRSTFFLGHGVSFPAQLAPEFLHGLRAKTPRPWRRPSTQQRVERGLDDVVRIRGADGFRQHVVNSRNLHHGAHRAAGDDSRAFGRGLQQHLPRAVQAENLMRNRRALQIQRIKFFLACSMALRMAMGTSRALPMPNPAWPC
jgi:hypothetical protein